MIKNYGFQKPIIDTTQYILGASNVPQNILQADGSWFPYLPTYERQFTDSYDTFGCTVFGTLNALEILMKKIYNKDLNYSERFNYILAQIRPPGSDPHKVCETVRKNGVVLQEDLPITTTYEEFIKPDPLTDELIDKGKEWLKDFDFLHEWVFTNNPTKKVRIALLKQTLQYSPVCISVTAWHKDEKDFYIDNLQPNTHWVVCYKIDDDGTMYVFDSYDGNNPTNPNSYLKKLHPEHHIEYAKRFSISVAKPKTPTLFEVIKNTIISLLKKLFEKPLTNESTKKIIELQTKLDDLVNKNIIPELPKFPQKIIEWAKAIEVGEGARPELNNPGNLKYSKLTSS